LKLKGNSKIENRKIAIKIEGFYLTIFVESIKEIVKSQSKLMDFTKKKDNVKYMYKYFVDFKLSEV